MRIAKRGLRSDAFRPTVRHRPCVSLCLINPQSAVRSLKTSCRPAYTLVELMLVLAIVAALAAVAWPSVLRMQADYDLSSAAEQVRQQIGQARARAVHAGLAFQFRYEPKGRHFCVIPFEAEPEAIPVSAPSANTPVQAKTSQRFAGEVSKRITFQPPASNTLSLTAAQKVPEAAFQGLPNAGTLTSVNWSGPLIFHPDGTAADALITLGDPRGHRIDISIRGLTGAATVSPIHREATR